MNYWTYGLNDQGEPQLLGPFETGDDANDAGAELNRVQVFQARDRQDALRQLQRGAVSRRQPIQVDEPQKGGWISQEYDDFERSLEGSTE